MTFSDEVLMAYADGELAGPERSAVERAMHEDPAVAEAIARHRQLRGDVFAAFADVLDEPVPVPLRQAVQPKVAGLEAARVARSGQGTRAQGDWWRWGGMAASLVVGILVGIGGWQAYRQDGGTASLVAAAGGVLAQGKLADALSRELAGSPAADASVRIGVTFQARDGNYCRSFALAGAAGLACREGDAWRVAVLQQQAPAAQPAYRQAGVAMPPAVLEAIDERIAGTALDAAGERAARERGWRR